MVRLAIIDDEYGIRNGIASYFPWASLGIEVGAVCEDGIEALKLMERERFELVLCDIRMPRMDGIRFAEIVRERKYPCKIVFISAYKDFDYAKRALELGVRNYIVKPAGYEELYEVFSRILMEMESEKFEDRSVDKYPDKIAGSLPTGADDPKTGAVPQPGCGSAVPGSAVPDSAQSGPGTDLVDRVVGLLEKDLRNLSLSSVARHVGMSPNYLSTRLHTQTGRTFSDLLNEARMKRARILLANRALHVHEISAMVGYASTKSFIRAFRTYFGTSPTGLRGMPNV